MVFSYVYEGVEYSGEEWEDAYNTFVNPSGVAVGGAVYGAIFRPRGASVMNFGKYDGNGYSEDLTLLNVLIHDLSIETEEIPTFGTNKEMWVRDSINAPVPFVISTHNNLESVPEMIYAGNVWTDLVVGLKKHATSWWHLGRMSISDNVVDWVESGQAWQELENTDTMHCNMDSLGHLVKVKLVFLFSFYFLFLFIHFLRLFVCVSTKQKGVLGMKMEYVSGAKLTNVQMKNIASLSSLGSEVCGEYNDGKNGGHALQSRETNEGWGGSVAYGMWFSSVEDIEINGLQMSNFVSYNGRIFGLRAYKSEHEITVKSSTFSNFFAGALLAEDIGYEDAWPNAAASACAMEDDNLVGTNEDISVSCMNSRATCSCDSVSCAGTIEEYCEGFEIETPKHKLFVAADKTVETTEKIVEMKIGLRDADYVELLESLEQKEEEAAEVVENDNLVRAFDVEEGETDGDEEGSLISESSKHSNHSIWEIYWSRYWLFFVIGLVVIACLSLGGLRICRRRRNQAEQKRLLEKERIDNANAYAQGLVTVEDDSDDEF